MKKVTRTLHPGSRHACYPDRAFEQHRGGVWRRRDDYMESILRFEEELERDARLIAASDNLIELPPATAHDRVQRSNSSDHTARAGNPVGRSLCLQRSSWGALKH